MASLETLRSTPEYELTRSGRFLRVELCVAHRVQSTSAQNGGQSEHVRYLVNHQSCEGADHRERHHYMVGLGPDRYHDAICAEMGLAPELTAVMGTAANMNYLAIKEEADHSVAVTALVTAGVQGNAACAGDAANWRERDGKWEKVSPYQGTINTILLISRPLTPPALARGVVTMTEAKTAALVRLAVGSLYSADLATGTGTDQFCLAAPLAGERPFTSTSPHAKLGEMIGVAVRDATLEALRWQNGLELSYTRSIFHALGRFGLKEDRFAEEVAPMLSERNLELLKKNAKSVFYEPLVAASAFAVAAVLDRARYGTLPTDSVAESLRQHAALLACNLAAKPEHYTEFRRELRTVDLEKPLQLILAAIAAGWSAKWT